MMNSVVVCGSPPGRERALRYYLMASITLSQENLHPSLVQHHTFQSSTMAGWEHSLRRY